MTFQRPPAFGASAPPVQAEEPPATPWASGGSHVALPPGIPARPSVPPAPAREQEASSWYAEAAPPATEPGPAREEPGELPVFGVIGDPVTQTPDVRVAGAPASPESLIQAAPAVPADALVRKNVHGDPLMRRLGSGMLKAVGGGAASDAREQAEVSERLARRVSACRQIAVVSVRGGAGKTTLAALAAAAIADHREDRVLAIDADSALGSLPLRLGVRAQHSLPDLAAANPRSWDEAAGYLARRAERLWVLAGSTDGTLTAELGLDTFRSAFGWLARYFSTAIIDCGAGILGALQRGVLETAHAQLLVTPGTVDGALSARGALEWFGNNGHGALLSRTVIALVTHTPHADADLERVRSMLSSGGLPVVHLPYDRHLATGTSIDMSRLGAATRIAATRIAAEVFIRSTGG